jgi:hypothetical protein
MGSAEEESSSSNGTKIAIGAGATAGCLSVPVVMAGGAVVIIIFGGLGVLLMPLIILIMIFGGGGGPAQTYDTGEQAIEIAQSDGHGALDPAQVPADLVDTLEDGGDECGTISPVILAAQIEVESNWNASLEGSGGSKGLSQLNEADFATHGKDTDDNGKTSALDSKDSIMAQARYLCALADQVQSLKNAGQVDGDVLNLTLAAYDVGIDPVKEAHGMPHDAHAQSYVVSVRARFARYQGVGAPPTSFSVSPSPTKSDD